MLTTAPELIVVGGGLARAGDLLTEALGERIAERCDGLVSPTIVVSRLAEWAVARGGVALALDEVEGRLFAGDVAQRSDVAL